MEDPDKLNLELSHRLHGCALVCELDLDEDLHARLTAAVQVLEERGVARDEDRLRRYAPLVATYLVAEGIFNFAQGAYWPNLSVPGLERAILTHIFEHALATHRNLERFRALVDAGAQRYLTPILAHGGIPRYSLHDFFTIVLHADRHGAMDAAEMLAYWREHLSVFVNIDKPVERFLLYGGDISVDFLDRCVDLIRTRPTATQELPHDRFGLPAYVCDAYLQLDPAERRSRSADGRLGQATALPRPFIFVDPWDASGPTLVLPAVANSLHCTWDVVSQERAARHQVSRSERVVPLEPALHWGVELREESGGAVRTFTFPGLARGGIIFFDYDDGRLVTELSRLRSTRVWVLRREGENGELRHASGVPLTPFESAPRPAGAWDGYILEAYELPDGERLSLGRSTAASGQADGAGTSFWVRVRGERISLAGEPVDGVRTPDGMPIFAAAPTLILPGFGLGSESARASTSTTWFVRIAINGIEHVFDADALSRIGADVIRSVVPIGRITRVQLTARGPLGMDLRTAFCVVPGLTVARPRNVLLPARDAGRVVARVSLREPTGAIQHVDVHGGEDVVTASVRDERGSVAELHITVPALQWAFASEGSGRSDLCQEPLRLSSRDLLEDRVALLAVRVRQPHVPLRLELRHDDRVMQVLEASTAGVDGRWAFDLRRYSGSIATSAEPILSLVLSVNGFAVPVGTIRAELDVADLVVHQRIIPGQATVLLTWREARPLRHRVARLWPLTTPWASPIITPVADTVQCEATIAASDSDLPPGCYLAEIGMDDGWTAVRRPRFSDGATRQFRLGTEREEREWIARLGDADAFAVLAVALAHGHVTRTLLPYEVERVTSAALDALWVTREQGGGTAAPAILQAIATLITSDQDALVAGIEEAAGGWDIVHAAPLLAAVLDVLARLPHSPAVLAPPRDTDKLWELCPPIAAALDLRHAGEKHVRVRSEAGLGATLEEALQREIIPSMRGRMPQLQRFIQMPVETLEALLRASGLVPRRPLDLDSQAAVQFEWLLADQREVFSAEDWCAAHRELGESLDELRPDLARGFEALRAPGRLLSAFPAIRLPELVHLAALHTIAGTPTASRAVTALREIVQACPGIVTRALVIASVHTHLTACVVDANA
ncbi:MAG TPA: hypothetical protein VFW89_08785 [Gemmatimonadaceae bacterium]|nr:hypothetical protein [Gemmatimonadaceae bacterium]